MPETEWVRGFLHECRLREPLRQVLEEGEVWLEESRVEAACDTDPSFRSIFILSIPKPVFRLLREPADPDVRGGRVDQPSLLQTPDLLGGSLSGHISRQSSATDPFLGYSGSGSSSQ